MSTGTRFYLGIDVSKPYFDAALMAVIDHVKQPVITERFENTSAGIKSFHKYLKKHRVSFDQQTILVIENTGVYHRLIWSFCSDYHLPIYIGNASHIKWSFGLVRGKNDVIDSKRLCSYAYKHADEIVSTQALNPILMKLKDLMTARSNLVSQRGSILKYLKELKLFNDKGVQKIMEQSHKAALKGLKLSIEKVETEINKIISDPSIKTNYDLIKSVPGIGHLPPYISCAVLTTLQVRLAVNNWLVMLALFPSRTPAESASGDVVRSIRWRTKSSRKCFIYAPYLLSNITPSSGITLSVKRKKESRQ